MIRHAGIVSVLLLAFGPAVTPIQPSSGGQSWQQSFHVDLKALKTTGRNDYFLLEPGARSTFRGREGGKAAELVITVLDETRTVGGVDTRVVEERETVGGEIVEVSRNYFAIGPNGDVYYFGEAVDAYKHGKVM